MRYPKLIRYGLAALVFGAVGTAVGVGLAGQDPPRSHVPPGLSSDKAAQVQHQVDDLGKAGGNRKPAPADVGGAAPYATSTPVPGGASGGAAPRARVAGINDEMRQGPFPTSEFRVANFYQGPASSRWYLVYAGSLAGPDGGGAGRGALRVLAESDANDLTPVGTYAAPGNPGPLKVVRVNGAHLTLMGGSGQTLAFNLETLRYG